jgi:hypothetical protein
MLTAHVCFDRRQAVYDVFAVWGVELPVLLFQHSMLSCSWDALMWSCEWLCKLERGAEMILLTDCMKCLDGCGKHANRAVMLRVCVRMSVHGCKWPVWCVLSRLCCIKTCYTVVVLWLRRGKACCWVSLLYAAAQKHGLLAHTYTHTHTHTHTRG